MIDVYIHDTIGMGFDMRRPLGGSEVGLLLLAEALRKRGLYVSFNEQHAEVCIVSRYSPVPKEALAKRTVVYAADICDERYDQHLALPIQCVSEFQAQTFRARGFTTRTIFPIMGDHVYDCQHYTKHTGRWIYASAAGKGLRATLLEWARNPRSEEPLLVTTSGYDEPDRDLCETHHARYIGRFNPRAFVEQIAMSHGMYYRNVAPECFPMTVAIAKTLGLELDIRCVDHDVCGIAEGLGDHDLRESTVISQWIEFLGLS